MHFPDIVLNFRTTFVSKKGEVVSNSKAIALNYIRSWFVVDLLAALPFDLLYASDVYSGAVSSHCQLIKLTTLLLIYCLNLKRSQVLLRHSGT